MQSFFKNTIPTSNIKVMKKFQADYLIDKKIANKDRDDLFRARYSIDYPHQDYPIYESFTRGIKSIIASPYHISDMKLISSKIFGSIEIEYSSNKSISFDSQTYRKTKVLKVDLDFFRKELEKTSQRYIKKQISEEDAINYLINKFGTLRPLNALHNNDDLDEEYKSWKFLINSFIPSISSFIDKNPNISLKDLNQCFTNVRPSFTNTNQNAFEFIPNDLLGAIMLHLKTKNLKKSPLQNCLNCHKEIFQSQNSGRPVMFCRNNSKCKRQYYRKLDRS